MKGAKLAEGMIEANGVELCTERIGDPDDPPILLAMGIGASISTSPATPGERRLPPAAEPYRRFLATADVDWAERDSVVDYLVQIPGARLLTPAGAGDGVDRADWKAIVRVILEHTAATGATSSRAAP